MVTQSAVQSVPRNSPFHTRIHPFVSCVVSVFLLKSMNEFHSSIHICELVKWIEANLFQLNEQFSAIVARSESSRLFWSTHYLHRCVPEMCFRNIWEKRKHFSFWMFILWDKHLHKSTFTSVCVFVALLPLFSVPRGNSCHSPERNPETRRFELMSRPPRKHKNAVVAMSVFNRWAHRTQ